MLYYPERKKLVKEFRRWAYENKAIDCLENYTLFLYENNFLNLDEIYGFLGVQNDLY